MRFLQRCPTLEMALLLALPLLLLTCTHVSGEEIHGTPGAIIPVQESNGPASNSCSDEANAKGECVQSNTNGREEVDVSLSSESFLVADVEPFIPTHEWQTLKPNQPIPPGLHVQLDLTTGEKRAKLMEDEEKPGIRTLSEKRKEKLEIIKSKLSLMFGQPEESSQNETSRSGTPQEDLYEDYRFLRDSVTLTRINDLESNRAARNEKHSEAFAKLDNFIEHLLITPPNEDSAELQVAILEELEELVHEVEVASYMVQIGLADILVAYLNQSYSPKPILRAALRVMAAASQNNPEMQQVLISRQSLSLFLYLLQNPMNTAIQRDVVGAISSLVRGNPSLRSVFLLEAFPVLDAMFVHSPTKGTLGDMFNLQIKVLTLFSDLILEECEELRGKDDKIEETGSDYISYIAGLLPACMSSSVSALLVEQHWVDHAARLFFHAKSDDQRQKALEFLAIVVERAAPSSHGLLHTRLRELLPIWENESLSDDSSYFAHLHALGTHILGRLRINQEF